MTVIRKAFAWEPEARVGAPQALIESCVPFALVLLLTVLTQMYTQLYRQFSCPLLDRLHRDSKGCTPRCSTHAGQHLCMHAQAESLRKPWRRPHTSWSRAAQLPRQCEMLTSSTMSGSQAACHLRHAMSPPQSPRAGCNLLSKSGC